MNIRNTPFEDIKGDVDSLGGLVMELSGKIPDVHEELSYKNFRFKVLALDGHRVKRVRVSRVEEE
jgi:CBS domain containing-hemolysin-like protein